MAAQKAKGTKKRGFFVPFVVEKGYLE